MATRARGPSASQSVPTLRQAAARTRGGDGAEKASPAFVGRDDALAAVTGALHNGPALVLIEGEAGIGKTRLVREALASVTTHAVLVAACPPLPEPFPLGPVVDGLRRLWPDAAKLGPGSLGVRNPHGLSRLCGALRPLFPEWTDLLPPAPEPLDDPKETRHRVLSALTEFVERVDVEILLVEDAHWADSATLEWLLTLTASGDLGLPIVVTYRPTDVPEGSLVRRLTSRPPAGMQRVRVELEPLNVDHARQLVGSMLGTVEVSGEFARFLHERTDGVPLALEETVRLIRDRRDIIREGGSWSRRVLAELEVPPTVRDSVLERVQRLGREARAVLEAAAVLAAPAGEALLTAVACLDADKSQTGLADALASGLLQETDPGRFVFRHVLDAQAVSEAIPVSRRRHLHAKAAEELRQLDPEPVVRLARHFREAGDSEAWCRYGEAAADLARESGDYRTAVATLVELLAAIEHPADRRTRLAGKLGGAATRAPLDQLGMRILGVLGDVVADCDVPAVVRGEIRFQLGRLLLQLSEVEAAFGEFEAALPDLEDRPELAAVAMLFLAFPLPTEWPVARHLAWLRRAMELLPRIDSPSGRLSFTVRYATGLLLLGEESGWAAAREIPRRAETEQERRDIASGLLNVAQCAAMWGHYEEARTWLAAADDLIRETGALRARDTARGARAHLNWCTGEWDGVDALVAAVADSEYAQPTNHLEAQYLQGLLDLARGARRPAEQRLREAQAGLDRRRQVEPFWFPSAALARISLAEGSPEDALDVTAPAVEVIVRKGVWVWATDIAPVHVEALVATGRVEQAVALVGQFTADLDGRDSPAPAAALVVCRAIVAEAQGDHTRAAELFAEAAAAWAALPRPYDELLALERQGLVLLAAGDEGGNEDTGLAVLADTERRLRHLGARWDADRVAHVLRRRGVEVVRTWRRGPKGYGDELSPRELQVVELVARGMTNRQVADALFISHRTVGEHLSKAMRKLNVSSRAALVLAASNAGLLPIEMVESWRSKQIRHMDGR